MWPPLPHASPATCLAEGDKCHQTGKASSLVDQPLGNKASSYYRDLEDKSQNINPNARDSEQKPLKKRGGGRLSHGSSTCDGGKGAEEGTQGGRAQRQPRCGSVFSGNWAKAFGAHGDTGLGYTWLLISPFSGTKTCTGAPSGDLRGTYTVATCRSQEERRDL